MLNEDERIAFGKVLDKLGLPVGFNGDRLDAFRLGVNAAFETACRELEVPKPKPLPRAQDDKLGKVIEPKPRKWDEQP